MFRHSFAILSLWAIPPLLHAGPPTAFSVTDVNAVLRSPPPDAKPLAERIPYGTLVEITREVDVGGTVYVEVKEQGKQLLGWTAKANLGSAKEFDPAMRPDDRVSNDKLAPLDLRMASLYNTRGKYLKQQAIALGIQAAPLAAVLQVESGGRGFSNDGRMIIRFENHIFNKYWGKAHQVEFDKHFKFDSASGWKLHEWRKDEAGSWEPCHKNQAQEWRTLLYAQSLDEVAGTLSASYGTGQIMGFNHKAIGYPDAKSMFAKMNEGIKPQLDGMIAFIRGNKNCMKGLTEKDYVTFAKGYNGLGQAAAYGKRIEDAAASYAKMAKGKKEAD